MIFLKIQWDNKEQTAQFKKKKSWFSTISQSKQDV